MNTTYFIRDDIKKTDCSLLNKGKWGNADVYLLSRQDGKWVVKDFYPKSWLARNIIGRYMVRKEMMALNRLSGVDGIPVDAFRLDAYCVCYRYIEGCTTEFSKIAHFQSRFLTKKVSILVPYFEPI